MINTKANSSLSFRSRLIRKLRFLLPISAVVLILGVVLWPNFQSSNAYKDIKRAIKKANVALNLMILSTDSLGKPYKILAKSAEQLDELSALLGSPSGEFILEDGTKVSVKANAGDLKKADDSLVLNGQVHIKSETGYELNAPSAKIDLKTKTAESFEPVFGKGPSGKIEAQKGVKIHADGIIVFKGKTELVVYPKTSNQQVGADA